MLNLKNAQSLRYQASSIEPPLCGVLICLSAQENSIEIDITNIQKLESFIYRNIYSPSSTRKEYYFQFDNNVIYDVYLAQTLYIMILGYQLRGDKEGIISVLRKVYKRPEKPFKELLETCKNLGWIEFVPIRESPYQTVVSTPFPKGSTLANLKKFFDPEGKNPQYRYFSLGRQLTDDSILIIELDSAITFEKYTELQISLIVSLVPL